MDGGSRKTGRTDPASKRSYVNVYYVVVYLELLPLRWTCPQLLLLLHELSVTDKVKPIQFLLNI